MGENLLGGAGDFRWLAFGQTSAELRSASEELRHNDFSFCLVNRSAAV